MNYITHTLYKLIFLLREFVQRKNKKLPLESLPVTYIHTKNFIWSLVTEWAVLILIWFNPIRPGGGVESTPPLVFHHFLKKSSDNHTLKFCDFFSFVVWNDPVKRNFSKILFWASQGRPKGGNFWRKKINFFIFDTRATIFGYKEGLKY